MSKWAWIVLALWMLALPVRAGGIIEARKQIEASMVLTGTIEIDAEGRLTTYALDQPDKVEPNALNVFRHSVEAWRFEPVMRQGRAVPAKSRMSVRIVARKLANGDFEVTIRDVDFPGLPVPAAETAVGKDMVRPVFPGPALRSGVSAMVYAVVKVGVDGRVEEAAIEQVNLAAAARESIMEEWRGLFSAAVLKAAKASTFTMPLAGEAVGRSMTVRIPYVFQVHGGVLVDKPYGQWVAYIPGPRQVVPWLSELHAGAPDLVAANTVQPLGMTPGLRLLGPPNGG